MCENRAWGAEGQRQALDSGDDLERLRRFAGEQGRSETGVAAALGAGMVGTGTGSQKQVLDSRMEDPGKLRRLADDSERQATDEEVLQKLDAEIRQKRAELEMLRQEESALRWKMVTNQTPPKPVDPSRIYRDGEPEWAAENRKPQATQLGVAVDPWSQDRAHRLTRHHTPNTSQISRIKAVRNVAADFLRTIQTVNGQQLATTIEFAQAERCVREAMMWANAGIVLEGE